MSFEKKLAKQIAERTAALIASGAAPAVAAEQAATESVASVLAESADDKSAEALATLMSQWLSRFYESGIPFLGGRIPITPPIAARVFRHIHEDGTVTHAGPRSHRDNGGASDGRTTSNDFQALGIVAFWVRESKTGRSWKRYDAERGNGNAIAMRALHTSGRVGSDIKSVNAFLGYSENAWRFLSRHGEAKDHAWKYMEAELADGSRVPFADIAAKLAK